MSRFLTFALLAVLASPLLRGGTPAEFFNQTDALLMRYVSNGTIDYAGLQRSGALDPLIAELELVDLDALSGEEEKAYLINAYNLLVIKQVLDNYPLNSVLDVSGFFDRKPVTVGGRTLTLNELEKDLILRKYQDSRVHFVLVCGALGCPPITDFAYQPGRLDAQLERQTRLALNDPGFIRQVDGRVALSQIFEWYADDFGGSTGRVLAYINNYRESPLPTDARPTYYTYDWSLNRRGGRAQLSSPGQGGVSPPPGGGNNSARYVVSSAIPQGTFEIKTFNNLYSQEAGGERASFFTSLNSVLYGLNDRFNVGFDLRFRRVRYDEAGQANNFDLFRAGGNARTAVATIGPKIRIAPFEQLPNFSIQSAFWIPVADDLSGAETDRRFLDFSGPTWFTQVFNDFPLGRSFSLFAEVDFLIEDLGSEDLGRLNRFSTPVTGIFSYFPTPKTTLYGLASYSPYWQEDFDYFYQLGAGVKYQFTPNFEVEILATAFDNQFLQSVNGQAGTVNLGFRFNL